MPCALLWEKAATVMKDFQPPPGTEFFKSQVEIASRLGYTSQGVGHMIRTGLLRPLETRHDGMLFSTSDLTALRQKHVLGEIEKKCAQLSVEEREQLAAALVSQKLAATGQRMSVRMAASIVA